MANRASEPNASYAGRPEIEQQILAFEIGQMQRPSLECLHFKIRGRFAHFYHSKHRDGERAEIDRLVRHVGIQFWDRNVLV
jgi:hypothetical protein